MDFQRKEFFRGTVHEQDQPKPGRQKANRTNICRHVIFEISLNLKDNKLISLKLPEAGRHAFLRLRSTRITNNPRKDDDIAHYASFSGPLKMAPA